MMGGRIDMERNAGYLVELEIPELKIPSYSLTHQFILSMASNYVTPYIYTVMEQAQGKHAEPEEYERTVISSEEAILQLERVIWGLAHHFSDLCFWLFTDVGPLAMENYLKQGLISSELIRITGYGDVKRELLIPLQRGERLIIGDWGGKVHSHMRVFRFVGTSCESLLNQLIYKMYKNQIDYVQQLRALFWATNLFLEGSELEVTTFGEEECDHIMIKTTETLSHKVIRQVITEVYKQSLIVVRLDREAYRCWDTDPSPRLFDYVRGIF